MLNTLRAAKELLKPVFMKVSPGVELGEVGKTLEENKGQMV